MDQTSLENGLKSLPIGEIRYFTQISSTNDIAAAWAAQGAADLSLVVADEQTQGRGRGRRKWFTPPGSALAFSLILHPTSLQSDLSTHENTARLNGLGALAVHGALTRLNLSAKIKWPNDILLSDQKTAGILTESKWDGNRLAGIILGIGINVTPAAVPPADQLSFPATCIETCLGKPVNRTDLLRSVLTELLFWRDWITTPEFLSTWEVNLAFQDQKVQIVSEGSQPLLGQIVGLNPDGSLRLETESGEIISVQVGEIPSTSDLHLRPG